MINKIRNICVIGAGTMGNGIAQVFATKDFNVNLIDVSAEALTKALVTIEKNLDRMLVKERITEEIKALALRNISTFTSIESAVQEADLIIEAASENFQIKQKIFKSLDSLAPKKAILASNTSSISITKIAAATSRPENVIGMHFMNPVPVMKLVELIKGYSTSEETAETVAKISEYVGKIPVEVNDYPGFVANRILMPMINEAIYTLYESVAGVQEIDQIMKLGMGHPMGPLQLADFIGLDVCLAIMKVLHEGFGNPKYAPCPLLVNMVLAGKLGRKSGEGFYKYEKGSKDLIVSVAFMK